MIETGMILKAGAGLANDYFADSEILIVEHNANGALGFILNRSYPLPLNALDEFKHIAPFPLFEGGPVQQDRLYFIHRKPQLIPDGVWIRDDIYFGGNFQTAVSLINEKLLSSLDIRIFIGYTGWDSGQLTAELKEDNSWNIIQKANIFSL